MPLCGDLPNPLEGFLSPAAVPQQHAAIPVFILLFACLPHDIPGGQGCCLSHLLYLPPEGSICGLINTCGVNESNLLWQWCRHFTARGSQPPLSHAVPLPLSTLLCGLGNLWLGFLSAMSLCSQLLGGGHQDKWEEPKEEVSRFMLLPEHSLTGGEGRSSQWPLSHAISRPSLTTSPSPSSSGIFPSLQPFPYFLSLPFLPLPHFPFPFFHATPGWLQILPQAWSINLDPALTTLYFWNHPFKSVICFSPRPQLKRQESHVAFVCPTWPSQQAQGTKLISHIK